MEQATYYYNPPFKRPFGGLRGFRGLGDAASDYCAANPAACGGESGGTSSGGGGKTTSGWITDALSWLKTGSEVYSNTKNTGGGGGTTVINNSTPSTGMSMTTKMLIGAGAVAAVGSIVYVVTRKKK